MKIDQQIKVAVDAVVFGYTNNQIQILLIKQKYGAQKGKWSLPGGFVKDDESLTTAVKRELKEETGVKANYLEQLYTFGDVDRDARARVVSVAYMALINPNNYSLHADTDAEEAQWFDIKKLPRLAFDHKSIIKTGIERLRSKINYQPIGFELLSKTFPFSDLENLYQSILDTQIDRRNFRKKIMSFDLLIETDETHKPASGRPAKLFKFNQKKYRELEREGFMFEIKFA